MPDAQGELKVCFRSTEGVSGQVRWIAPSRLQAFDDAYCLTVHKSQGSEFDAVSLVLPDQDSPVLSRELLYTAITRARRRFSVLCSEKILEKTISKMINRKSGLRSKLWAEQNPTQQQLSFPDL